jgi:hypothetical protein
MAAYLQLQCILYCSTSCTLYRTSPLSSRDFACSRVGCHVHPTPIDSLDDRMASTSPQTRFSGYTSCTSSRACPIVALQILLDRTPVCPTPQIDAWHWSRLPGQIALIVVRLLNRRNHSTFLIYGGRDSSGQNRLADISPMDAHHLAIAALQQVTHDTSLHRHRDAASLPHSPNATGTDMKNNATDHDSACAHERSQNIPGTLRIAPDVEGSQESRNSANLALQPVSSNNSQSAADGHDVSTPPTSSSDGLSSQSASQDAEISQLSQLSHLAAAQQPMGHTATSRPDPAMSSTAGYKRTADGQVKPPSPPCPHGARSRGHSRNTSTLSNISSSTNGRIGEVNND